ncbi:MAG: hypothetical protein IT305_23150 [Chloroflexi bacterium]|nr:hypothetical protein [Chloroflexota bacterium]
MLRHAVGWSTPALALIALFSIQFAARREEVLGFWLGALLVVAIGLVVGGAAELHTRLHPAFRRVGERLAFSLWILPGLLMWSAGLALVLWRPDDLILARGLPLLGALLVGLSVFAQDREIASADNTAEPAALPRQLLSLLTYLAAFGLFTLVYQIKERSLISATTTAFVSVLLSFVMLRGAGADRQRTFLYAALIGVAMGEVTWALNYWVVRELVGGAVLLLVFYVIVGLIEVVLRGELSRRLLAEYLGVGIVGFLFILSTAPWRP